VWGGGGEVYGAVKASSTGACWSIQALAGTIIPCWARKTAFYGVTPCGQVNK